MTDEFPKVADLTADFVLFVINEEEAKVLLVKRNKTSTAFPGCWAIPGGFLGEGERLIECAARELLEETGIELNETNLMYPGSTYVGVFDNVDRDPRGRVISHVYAAIIDKIICPTVSGTEDVEDAKWWDLSNLPAELAFDHSDVIREAYMKVLIGKSGASI